MSDALANVVDRDGVGEVGLVDRFVRERVLASLDRLTTGRIAITDPVGERLVGSGDAVPIRVSVRDVAFYRSVASAGAIGAGEAYVDGIVECDRLVDLLRIFAREPGEADALERGVARLADASARVRHALRRNTRAGSKRNIAAHYDLGNDLFETFLDETMMYSAAVFERRDEPLAVAQRRKLDRICQKLDLAPGDRVVEIGAGWGGMAIHAAQHYGCHVTTTTISREQHAYATARVRALGLADRVEVVLRDYRDLEGEFDKLISIEMVEAVGADFLETYFATCARLLRPSGLGLIQAITIEDHRYDQALRSVDFIKKHVFPGCFIPSVSVLTGAAARATDLRLVHLEDIGPSYAITLQRWRERFLDERERVRALGYDERFVRLWEYYLAYCEAGFEERRLGDAQLLFARPEYRGDVVVPALARLG